MRSRSKIQNKVALGDLIAVLFDETQKVSRSRTEQNVLVYLALKDLLKGKVHAGHPAPTAR